MDKIITYIFGAGASRNALPIVNEMPNRIKRLIERLESDELQLDDNTSYTDLSIRELKTKREYQLEMIESLKWMMEASRNHASVDTFAKKLFIKKKFKELIRLKIALSVFFICEQALNKVDYRYDAFFASLINDINKLPDNVRILSWNYDHQFELAFSEYTEQNEISSNQRWLRVHLKYCTYNNFKNNSTGFRIFKLNGTAGLYSSYYSRRVYIFPDNLKDPVDKIFVDNVTKNFVIGTYVNHMFPTLSFAWENELEEGNKVENIVSKAIENIKETYSLVVIGYSFPFFNREIDRKIIGSMTKLKRVYFQAPDAEILKERFEAIRDNLSGIDLLIKEDVGQFLLPNEL